ncbi:class III signal peptide-containing protein [Methanocaldococcus sp. 10A]
MKLLKKLLSKKGQLSMEVGILVAAAVLVAIIAGYYYIKNAKAAAKSAGQQAGKFVNTTNQSANNYLNKLNQTLS